MRTNTPAYDANYKQWRIVKLTTDLSHDESIVTLSGDDNFYIYGWSFLNDGHWSGEASLYYLVGSDEYPLGHISVNPTGLVPHLAVYDDAASRTPIYSSQRVGFEASKAFDRNPATYWSATATLPGTPAYIGVNFTYNAVCNLVRVKALSFPIRVFDPKDFKIQYHNGASWIDISSHTGVTWYNGEIKLFPFGSYITAQQFRMYITAVQGGTQYPGIDEFYCEDVPMIRTLENYNNYQSLGVYIGDISELRVRLSGHYIGDNLGICVWGRALKAGEHL